MIDDFLIEGNVLVKYRGPGGDVVVPEGVEVIEKHAFQGSPGVTSIVFPKSLREIRHEFNFLDGISCSKLREVTILGPIKRLGRGTFSHSSALTTVKLADGLRVIEDFGFSSCPNLIHINLPEGLEELQNGVFLCCTGLAGIHIPRTVTQLGWGVLEKCSSLNHVTIPEGVTVIPGAAFQGCTSLTDITLPEGLTEIGTEAFAGCTALETLSLPAGLLCIKKNAFERCIALREITIPAGVEKIEAETFRGCARLERVTLLGADTKIAASALRETTAEVVGLPLGKLPKDVRENTLRAFARQAAAGTPVPEEHRTLCMKYIRRMGAKLAPLAQEEPALSVILGELEK